MCVVTFEFWTFFLATFRTNSAKKSFNNLGNGREWPKFVPQHVAKHFLKKISKGFVFEAALGCCSLMERMTGPGLGKRWWCTRENILEISAANGLFWGNYFFSVCWVPWRKVKHRIEFFHRISVHELVWWVMSTTFQGLRCQSVIFQPRVFIIFQPDWVCFFVFLCIDLVLIYFFDLYLLFVTRCLDHRYRDLTLKYFSFQAWKSEAQRLQFVVRRWFEVR